MARARKGSANQAEAAVVEQVIDPKGLKKFSKHADDALGTKGTTITDKLGQQAAEGSLACTRFLVEMAERRVVTRRVTRRKKAEPSVAERLADGPEWSEEAGDEQPY